MARARNIKPGFFRNAELVELSFEARLLFIGLWTIADRAGRLEDRPKQIKMELFPADNMDCDGLLSQLAAINMIDRYEIDGKRIIQVVNFSKHQNPHRDEKPSSLPTKDRCLDDAESDEALCEHGASTVQTLCGSDAKTMAIGLNPDSLLLIPDSKEHGAEAPRTKKPMPELPDWVPVEAWNGYAEMRTRIRKPMTARAMTLVLKELTNFLGAGHDIAAVLDKSTRNNWVDVYAPKPSDMGQKLQNAPNNRPQWVIDAGFSSVAEAHNERCYERNANEFRDGKRVEVQA